MLFSRNDIIFSKNLCILLTRNFDVIEFADKGFEEFADKLEETMISYKVHDQEVKLLLMKNWKNNSRDRFEELLYKMLDSHYIKAIKPQSEYAGNCYGIRGLQFEEGGVGLELTPSKYNSALESFVDNLTKKKNCIKEKTVITKVLEIK